MTKQSSFTNQKLKPEEIKNFELCGIKVSIENVGEKSRYIEIKIK